jgi:hypothetical protein
MPTLNWLGSSVMLKNPNAKSPLEETQQSLSTTESLEPNGITAVTTGCSKKPNETHSNNPNLRRHSF